MRDRGMRVELFHSADCAYSKEGLQIRTRPKPWHASDRNESENEHKAREVVEAQTA
jgi:hypothetical protein